MPVEWCGVSTGRVLFVEYFNFDVWKEEVVYKTVDYKTISYYQLSCVFNCRINWIKLPKCND